jgi:MFS family permease
MRARFSLLTPTLRWFLLGMVLANIASAMVFTVASLYMADLGASVGQIGMVFTLAGIVPLILQVFGGWLSDSIGRLRTIAIGSSIATLGYLGFVLAPSWEWLPLALALEFVSGSLVGPSFGAFIADESSEEQRGQVFGLSQSIFMVVAVAGPPLAGWLSDAFSFRLTMLAAFILYCIATGLRIWMATRQRFMPTRAAERPTLRSFRNRLGDILALIVSGGVLTWILVTDGIGDISSRLSNELQPLYVTQVAGLSATQYGLLYATLGATMMVVTWAAGWLSDRTSERLTITLGFLLQAAGLALFVSMHGFYGLALAAIVMGAGFGTIMPAYDSLISKVVPENNRGMAYGFFRSSLGFISLPSPWIGGQLWEKVGPRSPFVITAVAALGSAWLSWAKFKLPGKEPAIPPAEQEAPL